MIDPKRINCKTCGITAFEENGETWCPNCSSKEEDRKADIRAVYREAYMAVLAGGSGPGGAHKDALQTVRQWPAMMAELEEVLNDPTR